MDSNETVNIGNVAKGSVPELFNHAMQAVLKNITDVNTSPTQKRQITLKFVIKPSESREVADISVVCEEKLASLRPVAGNLFIAKRGAQVQGFARDPKQDELFAAEKPAAERPS